MMSASALARTAREARVSREDASDTRDVCWKQCQGNKGIAVAVVVAAVRI